jgi:hypothetical protein
MHFRLVLCWLVGCLIALRAAPGVATAGPFEFHSGFWINLHHFLYEQALHETNDLTGTDRVAWDKAVGFYRQKMIQHDLIFDSQMRQVDSELAIDETLPTLPYSGLDGELRTNLLAVAPIYRSHWWATHDRANRAWIMEASPLVRQYGDVLIKQIETAYEVSWPKGPVRVDVVEYANWAGAYTFTWTSVHEIVSSADAANHGNAAIEILFHEAMHGLVYDRSGLLADLLAARAKAHGVMLPKDLVHIFIFYTAGELVRRDLAGNGVKDYMPYADKKGLYRGDWARWRDAIRLYWKPHLDGSMSFDDAVNKVVGAISGRR